MQSEIVIIPENHSLNKNESSDRLNIVCSSGKHFLKTKEETNHILNSSRDVKAQTFKHSNNSKEI